ncbi:MAG: hypothetical protein LBU83_08075 [Bacteroidales bacterium]|jgi:hypothetical protein|nr:hypothetical protein [Bacteroidales bacterium]
MNTKKILPILALFLIAVSCQTGSFVYYDDIYVKSTDSQYQVKIEQPAKQTTIENDYQYYEDTDYLVTQEPNTDNYPVEQEIYSDESGNTYITNNYYYEDGDYYDYYFSSRIKRFHTNFSLGFGYYDPFYTNMYWYNYSPAYWGVSIYLGYNWWWPSYYYRPWYYDWGYYNYGFCYGWGWGCHRPWYTGGYWNGYYDGYYAGYWAGYYHNNYDNNYAYYYGHRNNIGPSNGRNSTRTISGKDDDDNITTRYVSRSTPESFNQRYANITNNPSNSTRNITPNSSSETSTNSSPSIEGRNVITRGEGTNTDVRQTEAGRTTNTNTNTTRQTEPLRPTSPQTTTRQQVQPQPQTTTRQQVQPPPQTTTRQQVQPPQQQNNYNSGFRPDNSRSTPTYNPSSNSSGRSSYSSPSNSGSSYSSPSNSGSSYSSPSSRSGSSSSSSSSSGSSSSSRSSSSGGTRR